MVRVTRRLLLFSACVAAAPQELSGAQQVIASPETQTKPELRKLQGRFLHITDFHPDPFYKVDSDSSEDQVCHAGKGSAGHFGAEVTDCDSPFSLVNATFKWIEENIRDHIDFVVWTGDSARHDNDERYPRTDKQVINLNRMLVERFVETFGKSDNIHDPDPTNDFVVPIVPTWGNNDILPHNIFLPGPNKWTREYSDIWNKFVPQAQRHSFARGGWFFNEVIPNRLAVFSLNTLYFFDSNSAVDGCDLESEPGYEHMEWLRIQLQFLRVRGMKAILIGHVPPARTESKQNWDETCYQKYTLWLRQYRDVIITSIFGHMNIDHFMFQDVEDLTYKFKIQGVDEEFERNAVSTVRTDNEFFTIQAKAAYLNELRAGWSDLPKPPSGYSYNDLDNAIYETSKKKKKKKHDPQKDLDKFLKAIGGTYGERFSLSLVSPSIVPNYFPTLRIIEYNITGMENDHPAVSATGIPAKRCDFVEDYEPESESEDEYQLDQVDLYDESDEDSIHDLKKKKKKKKKGRKKKPNKPTFPVPKPPPKGAGPGPAYSPQPLSLISWTQYYANLTKIQGNIHKDAEGVANAHKHFKYQIEYTTNNDSQYHMKDLTIRSWLDIAEKMGRTSMKPSGEVDLDETSAFEDESIEGQVVDDSDPDASKQGKKDDKAKKKGKNHLWRTFIKRAFVHTKPEEDLEHDFGA